MKTWKKSLISFCSSALFIVMCIVSNLNTRYDFFAGFVACLIYFIVYILINNRNDILKDNNKLTADNSKLIADNSRLIADKNLLEEKNKILEDNNELWKKKFDNLYSETIINSQLNKK